MSIGEGTSQVQCMVIARRVIEEMGQKKHVRWRILLILFGVATLITA